MLFKIKHELVDLNPSNYLRHSDPRTRGAQRLYQERAEHPVLYNSFFPRTSREWNQLPTNTTEASTLEDFKLRLGCISITQPVASLP